MIEILQTVEKDGGLMCGMDCERKYDSRNLLACRNCHIDREHGRIRPSADCPISKMEAGEYKLETIISKIEGELK